MTTPNPREFFETIARLSYQEWLSDALTEWKAKAAVSNADIMAERVFAYWDKNDQSQVANTQSVRQYRTYLRDKICADFGLVWDVHDGHKHVTLDRPNRQVTSATQTGLSQIGFGEGRFGEGIFGGGDQIVIELDDHSKRALSGVMKNVMAMWDKLVADMCL
jgi:hypothetical protein